ncbi:hypothetical protein CEF21_03100 [Bacillus sp. FJAT-42376]|nr:hypothetical protein CEF21_03100 [Bacillus sp. FJAT-42376]
MSGSFLFIYNEINKIRPAMPALRGDPTTWKQSFIDTFLLFVYINRYNMISINRIDLGNRGGLT